ncbi:DUF2493 domain-containing protein [Novosphingobium terrae]|uniref:DUF2493 domain-containing protein n=1 Tax=Novosphingobium terrae TaxID=2726189 RepID=UPI001980994E|nr:DUF2493 domain-containing protein [Novosphingobium terrae]
MPSFSSFNDLAQHYAEALSQDSFSYAFAAEIAESQLSIHDEPTQADMPDPELARDCITQLVGDLFHLMADTRLEPLAGRIAWGVVNSLHRVAQQVERQEDDTARELGELARIMDPSEVHSSKLEETQRLCQSQAEARAALECMRDHAAQVYRIHTGSPWSSASGSRTSATPYASQIEARDFRAARRAAKQEAHNPQGPIVVVSGGVQWLHHEPIWERLDLIKARIPNMVLVTTGQHRGADKIASAWADHRGVHTVMFRLSHRNQGKAGFDRNKSLINLQPVEAIICEGSFMQVDLAKLCRGHGVPVTIMRNADFAPEPAAGAL